jgi:hypothetical protein
MEAFIPIVKLKLENGNQKRDKRKTPPLQTPQGWGTQRRYSELRRAHPPYVVSNLDLKCPVFSRGLGGGDEDFAGAARGGLFADDDFDVAVERGEKLHEPFDRKPVQAVIG